MPDSRLPQFTTAYEDVRRRVSRLESLFRDLFLGKINVHAACCRELTALRVLWRRSPELFSDDVIRSLKEFSDSLKKAQPIAGATDIGGMDSLKAPAYDPERVLRDVFGYTSFRPGQRELIDEVLAGRDAVGIMPTGAGKSLAYQIPAHMLAGTTLVVSPLIALMKDQVDALNDVGLSAVFVNSSLSIDERRRRIERAAAGEFKLVYAAPEGLEASVGQALRRVKLSLIAVDEAHCISHWGHDFRPAYRNLSGLKQRFGNIPVLALTATATEEVTRDIVEQLGIKTPAIYRGSFYRSNLQLYSIAKGSNTDAARKIPPVRDAITRLIGARKDDSGIVYCLSRKSTESLAAYLRQYGFRARAYHAGLDPVERTQVQEAFSHDDIEVVVATIAFGMGIDKSNVRYVIHRDMPRSIEGYYQEIGRAGRDGVTSDCILFHSWAEVIAYDKFAQGAPATLGERMRSQAREMFRFANSGGCRHQRLVGHFGDTMGECELHCDECKPLDLLTSTKPLRVKVGKSQTGETSSCQHLEQDTLFGRLKTLRRKLAEETGVPAFVVFSDASLLEMVARRPTSENEFLGVSGVGPVKLERYGQEFLELLREPLINDAADSELT